MRHLALALSAAGLFAACKKAAPPLYQSHAQHAPLEKKLRDGGGDLASVLVPKSTADLLKLAAGHPYKYAVRADGRLAVAPVAADDQAAAPWTHPLLAAGAAVRAAGFLRVDHDGVRIARATVDQDSRAYCPPAGSLLQAVEALRALGVGGEVIVAEDRPAQCDAAMQ